MYRGMIFLDLSEIKRDVWCFWISFRIDMMLAILRMRTVLIDEVMECIASPEIEKSFKSLLNVERLFLRKFIIF